MRDSDRVDLERVIGHLAAGVASRPEMVATITYLRWDAPPDSMLRDIGHSIAHDKRDKGLSYDYVDAFVQYLRQVFMEGGELKVPVMFPIEGIIDELVRVLDHLAITFDRPALLGRQKHLADLIADVLDGTRYKVQGVDVQLVGKTLLPHLLVGFDGDFKGDVISVPEGVRIGFSLLYSIPPDEPSPVVP